MNFRPANRSAQRRGFTAIELTAVASIIAILALILLPIVRSRLETVRINAALDDMRSIEVAQVLANADTGFYYRLSDLDNSKADLDTYKTSTSTGPTGQKANAVRSVPNGAWNRPFTVATEQASLGLLGSVAANWNGPYITYNRSKYVPLANAVSSGPPTYTLSVPANSPYRVVNMDVSPPTSLAGRGPILVMTSPNSLAQDPYNDDLRNDEHHPIDPWGGPYIFFGPGRMGRQGGNTALSEGTYTRAPEDESNFGTSAVYSLGPNAVPGDKTVPEAIDYFRDNRDETDPNTATILGTEDDLVRIF